MPQTRIIRSPEYNPSLPRSGSTGEYVFRLQNMIKRGQGDSSYWEAGGLPQNLSETIANSALTGTIALTAGSQTVTGTGTAFTTELHLGQFFLVVDAAGNRSFLCVVERVDSNISLVISKAPTASVSGKTGYRLPVIFAVDTQRGTALRGNVVRNDKGTLFSVGDGTFRLNGAALSATLALTRKPKVSIYNSGAGTYTHYSLGMPVPTGQTVAAVTGGTKGMEPAAYSILITAERAEYPGHGNPNMAERLDVTIAAGERPEITFGSMDAASGQSAWGVWATRFVDSLGQDKNYLNGPWFRVNAGSGADGQVLAGDLTAGKLALEWLDAEIETNRLITFDNDAPPDAEFVALFNGIPVWISCSGAGDTSPGPFISPAKPSNIEAAPAGLAYPTSPPETILGCVSALGRLYLLTSNHLQIAQGTPSDAVPVIIRPFWKAGFKNPYQLIFCGDMLYGNTVAGPSRSVGDGDEQAAATTWADRIGEFSKDWVTGHVVLEHDPYNDAVCYFHAAYSLNASGYWTTRVWMFGLTQQEWIGDTLLSSATGDMIVSGVAKVGDYLEFLCGGRQSDNSVSVGTYRFDKGTGSSVPYYMAASFTDSGEEWRSKRVGPGFIVNGKLTSASLKVYGAKPTDAVPVSNLESGTSALATLALTDGSDSTQGARKQANIKNLKQHTVRVEGTWGGSGAKDRIDEIVYEYSIYGARK
jgi:hypothetical protein